MILGRFLCHLSLYLLPAVAFDDDAAVVWQMKIRRREPAAVSSRSFLRVRSVPSRIFLRFSSGLSSGSGEEGEELC